MMNNEILAKIRQYCTYQERSEDEAKQKLRTLQIPDSEINAVLQTLIQDRYVDNDRFTEVFVRSKQQIKGWGKTKIKSALRQKGVSEIVIDKHLNAIDAQEYSNSIGGAIEKWLKLNRKNDNIYPRLYRFLASKGYECEQIGKVLSKYKLNHE